MKHQYAGLLLVAGVACAPAPAVAAKAPGFTLEITDNPATGRFDLRLVSLTSHRLCFDPYDWPNTPGQLSARATLQYQGGSLPSKDTNFGVPICPDIGCELLVLPPHGTISAFVSYTAFGESDHVRSLAGRRLSYSIKPVKCRSKWDQ